MKNKLYTIVLAAFFAVTLASCDREPSTPPEPKVDRIAISQLRAMFDGSADTVSIDTSIYIQGIVTLTPELSNIPSAVAYIQDSTDAICMAISATSTNTFAMDSKIRVYLKGLQLTKFKGLLQLIDVEPLSMVRMLSVVSDPPVPDTVTVAQLLTGAYESRYVYVKDVQFEASGTLSGNQKITDCASEIPVYTRSDASFASTALPTGRGFLKGISSIYNSQQILLRQPSEMTMTGKRCSASGTVYLEETFNGMTRYADASTLTGWLTYPEVGTKTWYANYKTSTPTDLWIQATAYGSSQASVKTWLITPAVDLTDAASPYLTFRSARGYDNGATLELFASTDYDGSDTPWDFTWIPMTFTLPASNASGYSSFVSSGNIDLTSYAGGNVRIAWVYTGADLDGTTSDKTTTWEVDNVTVAEQ
ncbi:MAG TPA: DUF5689 domain-containing protein [Bacteroidales bacterium]|nr:DUF5689 domain-containing protein [Bacteroidales bacterium]HPT11128.1 DUF5689 domain-containing protein [Bacteroidales bacterium]